MKIARLLSDRVKRSLSSFLMLPWPSLSSSVLVLLPCLFLLGGCSGGAAETPKTQQQQLQEVVDRLGAIQAQLEQNGHHAHRHPTLSKEQLRQVFQPLGDVLAQVVEQQQVDREQWMAMIADVRRLSQVVEVGVAQKEQGELRAMRQRLDRIDAQLREQDKRSREAKAALIQALDAAGSRLDGLLKELDAGPAKPKDEVEKGKDTGTGEGSGEGKGKGKAKGSGEGTAAVPEESEGAGTAFLITFLAISVVLLVAWVVFFPNRLRPVVPQVQYTARPDLQETEAPRGGGARGAPEMDHVQAAEVAEAAESMEGEEGVAVVEVPAVDGDEVQGPQMVQMQVVCGDPATAVERVAGFLAAEPRVLLHPEPDLQMHEDTLALRFYLVDAVPEDQQLRIEAAIRALAQENTPAKAEAKAEEKDKDLPAAQRA